MVSPEYKRHLDWFSHFVQLTADCTECPDILQWAVPFCFKIAPSHGGSGPDLDYLIHGSLGPSESSTQTASRSVELFLQGSLV